MARRRNIHVLKIETHKRNIQDYVRNLNTQKKHTSINTYKIMCQELKHTKEAYKYSRTKAEIKTQAEYNALIAEETKIPNNENEKLMCIMKAMRIMQFALSPDIFRLVNSYDTVKKIWDRFKELYSGDDDSKHSLQTTLLSEFGSFKKNSNENLEQTINRFNHL